MGCVPSAELPVRSHQPPSPSDVIDAYISYEPFGSTTQSQGSARAQAERTQRRDASQPQFAPRSHSIHHSPIRTKPLPQVQPRSRPRTPTSAERPVQSATPKTPLRTQQSPHRTNNDMNESFELQAVRPSTPQRRTPLPAHSPRSRKSAIISDLDALMDELRSASARIDSSRMSTIRPHDVFEEEWIASADLPAAMQMLSPTTATPLMPSIQPPSPAATPLAAPRKLKAPSAHTQIKDTLELHPSFAESHRQPTHDSQKRIQNHQKQLEQHAFALRNSDATRRYPSSALSSNSASDSASTRVGSSASISANHSAHTSANSSPRNLESSPLSFSTATNSEYQIGTESRCISPVHDHHATLVNHIADQHASKKIQDQQNATVSGSQIKRLDSGHVSDTSSDSQLNLESGHPCAFCQEPIHGKSAFLLGRHWHLEHSRCKECRRPIGIDNFVEIKGDLYCEDHYFVVNGNYVIRHDKDRTKRAKDPLQSELSEIRQHNTVRKVRNLFTFEKSVKVNMLSVMEQQNRQGGRQRIIVSWMPKDPANIKRAIDHVAETEVRLPQRLSLARLPNLAV